MKRGLFKVVIFLLLGAVVNVAVAWGCALLLDIDNGTRTYGQRDDDGVQVLVAMVSRPGATAISVERSNPALKYYLDEMEEDGPEIIAHLPRWSGLRHPCDAFTRGSISREMRFADARGWPMLSLWCEPFVTVLGEMGPNVESEPAQGRYTTDLPHFPSGFARHVPLLPIWPGFAVNTMFYAVILWLLVRGAFALRRGIRRWRGRCIKCGYDLRGAFDTGCPECGWGRAEAKES